MADLVYNVAKAQLMNGSLDLDNDDIRLLALEATGDQNADDTTVQAVLARAGTTELTSTGYGRKQVANELVRQDDANDRAEFDAATTGLGAISQAGSELVVGVLLYKHVTNDTDHVPIVLIDSFGSFAPNGSTPRMAWDVEGILHLT